MEIEETVRHDVVILEPKGRLTVETEQQFKESIERWLEASALRAYSAHYMAVLEKAPQRDR